MLGEVTLCLLRLCGGCILGLCVGCLLLLTGVVCCTGNRVSLLQLNLRTYLCMLLYHTLPMQLQHVLRKKSFPSDIRHLAENCKKLRLTRVIATWLRRPASLRCLGPVGLILPYEKAFPERQKK